MNSITIFALAIENGDVAQLVEQRTENPCVGGSIPSITTTTEVERGCPFGWPLSIRGSVVMRSVVTDEGKSATDKIETSFPFLKKFSYFKVMTQPLPYCTYVLFSEKDVMFYNRLFIKSGK